METVREIISNFNYNTENYKGRAMTGEFSKIKRGIRKTDERNGIVKKW